MKSDIITSDISSVNEPVTESRPEQNLPVLFGEFAACSICIFIVFIVLTRCGHCVSECVALYPYNGEEGDLSFLQGDVISITKSEGDWWEGKLHGKQGLFPANYVKKVENEVTTSLITEISKYLLAENVLVSDINR